MTTLREAAQQALEALTSRDGDGWTRRFARDRAIEALEAALAEPVQEPVGEVVAIDFSEESGPEAIVTLHQDVELGTMLYTAPPQSQVQLDVPETNFGDMVPVGWLENPFGSFRRNWLWKLDPPPQSLAWSIPLYTAPPQRKPLTDKQKLDLATNWFAEDWAIEKALDLLHDYDYEIEQAHGIKDGDNLSPTGCDHCRHPLYAAIKCSQCGRVTE